MQPLSRDGGGGGDEEPQHRTREKQGAHARQARARWFFFGFFGFCFIRSHRERDIRMYFFMASTAQGCVFVCVQHARRTLTAAPATANLAERAKAIVDCLWCVREGVLLCETSRRWSSDKELKKHKKRSICQLDTALSRTKSSL